MSNSLWPMDSHPPGFSVGFSRQEYWSRFPCLSPRNIPLLGSKSHLLHCRQVTKYLLYDQSHCFREIFWSIISLLHKEFTCTYLSQLSTHTFFSFQFYHWNICMCVCVYIYIYIYIYIKMETEMKKEHKNKRLI